MEERASKVRMLFAMLMTTAVMMIPHISEYGNERSGAEWMRCGGANLFADAE